MVNELTEKIGRYSGNRRLDTFSFEESDQDNEIAKEKWLGGKINIKRRLKRWINIISKTIDPEKLQIHMIGQSHIDIAWMWRFEQTRKKAQVTFRKAILHAKMFPNSFCFALSEPILLEWIKEDDPNLFKHIQDAVENGSIELIGGSYVEPDSMMPSGEAFIRQRLYGMRFYRDNFGILPIVEWFLDSFGYNYGLPQILVKSGAKYFWTNKLTWNLETTFPFVHFWWQGADGSQILTTHFPEGMQVFEKWDKYEVGRHLLKKNGKKIWDYTLDYSKLNEHVKTEICIHAGCFFGKGDGGHGPTHKEVALVNELVKYKMFKWSRVETYYKKLEKYAERFPVWNDELYLENHRGCFSNHAEVKRYNRKFENIIISLEILALITKLIKPSYQYPQDKLELLWKITLKNQFHDVLPGSSIPEVYDDCWDDWSKQDQIIEKIIKDVGLALTTVEKAEETNNSAEIYLFNPLSWERTSRVFIPVSIFNNIQKLDKNEKPNYAKLELFTSEKKLFICQPIAAEPEDTIDRTPAGWWAIIKMKPLSLIKARMTILNETENQKIQTKSILIASEDFISNGIIKIKLDSNTGAILELIAENINGGDNLLIGYSSNLTFGFLDNVTKELHAWNLTREYWNHPIELSNNQNVKIKVTEIGPIFVSLEIKRTLGTNDVIQKIALFNNCPEIFLEYLTNWKQKDIMLKVLYSTRTHAERVVSDGAYCAIQSETNPKVPCDKARYEKICHNYFDLSTPDRKWGLALLNEGKYAFDVNGGDMRLTMLRVCRYPFTAPEAWVNQERRENIQRFGHEVPEYSGLGPFKCRYALLPHEGGALLNSDGSPNVIVKRKAEEFNKPIIIIPTKGGLKELKNPFLEILTPNVYLETLKMNEWENTETIIVRFIEGSGIPTTAKIKFNSKFSENFFEIRAVDLLERKIERNFDWNEKTGYLTFEMDKFEISTFKIKI